MMLTATLGQPAYFSDHARAENGLVQVGATETTMNNTMNDRSQISLLTDGDLDQVSGGMDCNAAIGLSAVYASVAAIYSAIGNEAMAGHYSGRALGVFEGGCR